MIPLLIISDDPKLIQDYVDELKKNGLFFKVTPSTKEYSIEDIKNIGKETKVFYPKTRYYFLPEFHLSSLPAQNSFLKLLEEPPANIQFILSTNNKNNLLGTVVSRTKIVKLENNKKKNIVAAQFIAPVLEGLVNQIPKGKIPLLQFKIADRESSRKLLLQIIYFFDHRLSEDRNAAIVLKEILRLMGLLENNNLNPQLTVDQALIFIWKKYRIN